MKSNIALVLAAAALAVSAYNFTNATKPVAYTTHTHEHSAIFNQITDLGYRIDGMGLTLGLLQTDISDVAADAKVYAYEAAVDAKAYADEKSSALMAWVKSYVPDWEWPTLPTIPDLNPFS